MSFSPFRREQDYIGIGACPIATNFRLARHVISPRCSSYGRLEPKAQPAILAFHKGGPWSALRAVADSDLRL